MKNSLTIFFMLIFFINVLYSVCNTNNSKSSTSNILQSKTADKATTESTISSKISLKLLSKNGSNNKSETLNSNLNNNLNNNKKSLIGTKLNSFFTMSNYLNSNLSFGSNSKLNFKFLLKNKHNSNFKNKSNLNTNLHVNLIDEKSKRETSSKKNLILWDGWIKYIKISGLTTLVKPSNFFINNDFYSQRLIKTTLMEKDKNDKFINIVSQFHFYAKLNEHTLNILSARIIESNKNSDSLSISSIGAISNEEKLRYSGAVQPLGEFKEGFCLQVFTLESPFKSTNISNYSWVICTDSLIERDALIELLIDLKLNAGDQSNNHSKKLLQANKMSDLSGTANSADNLTRGTTTSPNDGRWIILQDWSQCSQKCGGGKQYQQWMCVPPKPNGKPCEGESVLTRDCNMQPCPSYGINDQANSGREEILKPIIKALPFSQRPQERILCKIREGDVLFDSTEDIDGRKVVKRMPARLVLNERTISIFQDDSYTKSEFNFPLDIAEINKSTGNHCCLLINGQQKTFNVCGGFGTNCGTPDNPVFANSWIFDFDLFKHKCSRTLKEENWAKQQDDKVANEEINQVKMDIVNETENILNEKLEKKKEEAVLSNIRNSQATAVKVLKKEFNLEEMLAKEEQQKALNETKELLLQKKSEEKKKDCLEQALKFKEEEHKKKLEVKLLMKSADQLKEETVKEVEEQRELLKKRIASIRKKSQKRNRQIKREINIIRSKMTQGIMDADKIGNKEICLSSVISVNLINSYCNDFKNITPEENIDCKDKDRFCYICCDTEFGSIHMDKREGCYRSCDDVVKSNNRGNWVWNNKSDNK